MRGSLSPHCDASLILYILALTFAQELLLLHGPVAHPASLRPVRSLVAVLCFVHKGIRGQEGLQGDLALSLAVCYTPASVKLGPKSLP